MANGYSVTITAQDNVSAVLAGINRAFGSLVRPLNNIQGATKKLGDELGITKLHRSFVATGQAATNLQQRITNIIPLLGTLSAALTVAGATRLAQSWGQVGLQMTNTSQRIGVSTARLTQLQGAARAAGGSAEAMTDGLRTLGETLTSAAGGRDPQAIQNFRMMGVEFRNVSGRARNAADVLPEVADALARMRDPLLRAQLGTELLGGAYENLAPMLLGGRRGLEEYTAMAARLNSRTPGDIENAARFGRATNLLGLAFEGVANSIQDRLFPRLTPMIERMTQWFAVNRDWLNLKIDEAVGRFAGWLERIDWTAVGNGITDFGNGVSRLVEGLGGWSNVATGIAVLMAGSFLAPIVSATTAVLGLGLAFGGAAVRGVAALTGAILSFNAAAAAGAFGTLLRVAGPMAAFAYIMRPATTNAGEADALARSRRGEEAFPGLAPLRQDGTPEEAPPSWLGRLGAFLGLGGRGGARPGGGGAAGELNMPDPDAAARLRAQLTAMGFAPHQADGILANAAAESGLRTNAVGDGGASGGLFQWRGERRERFRRQYGIDVTEATEAQQLAFMRDELRSTHSRAGAALAQAPNSQQAARVFSNLFEIPADQDGEARRRGNLADRLYDARQPPAAAAPVPGPGAAAPGGGNVQVDVTLRNAPPGTTATAVARGAATAPPPRIERAMPGSGP